VRRFVLVVVLVLESGHIRVMEYWSVGVLRQLGIAPAARGWECFQGVSFGTTNPGLKPWAKIYSRFAVKANHFHPN
jgi:hypothetical protein